MIQLFILDLWMKLQRDERGISALEYAVLAAVLIGLIVTAVELFGGGLSGLFGGAIDQVVSESGITPRQ